MEFRLCLALGIPHPDFLKEILSGRQLDEWREYAEVEPFGPWRDEERFAMIRQQIASLFLAKGKRPPAVNKFSYYLIKDERIRQSMSGSQILEFFQQIGGKKK